MDTLKTNTVPSTSHLWLIMLNRYYNNVPPLSFKFRYLLYVQHIFVPTVYLSVILCVPSEYPLYPSNILCVSIEYPVCVHRISCVYLWNILCVSIEYPLCIHRISSVYLSNILCVSIEYPLCIYRISSVYILNVLCVTIILFFHETSIVFSRLVYTVHICFKNVVYVLVDTGNCSEISDAFPPLFPLSYSSNCHLSR